MKRMLHAVAGTLALLLVVIFLVASLYAEVMMDQALIAETKSLILYGICLLVPAMAAAGGSGFSLVGRRAGGFIDVKKTRMRILVANGLLVMLPSAIWLHLLASAGNFGAGFFVVQAVEFAGGLVQLYLLGRNFRDGLALSGRLRRLVPSKTKTAG